MGHVGRRQFLTGTAVTLGVCAFPEAAQAEQQKEINCLEWCAEFRRLLLQNSGIHNVYIMPNLGSQKIAVAWEQFHNTQDVHELHSISESANRCQLQLYDAMGSLDHHPDFAVTDIIDEGIHRGLEQSDQDNFSTEITNTVREVLASKQSDPLSYFPSDRIIRRGMTDRNILKSPDTVGSYSILGWHGSSRVRAAQGRTKIIHGEDPTIKDRADQIVFVSGGTQEEMNEWVFNRRENYVISMADSLNQSVFHVIYGCAHNWADNVAQLRARFTLVIVRPNEVVEHRRKHPDHFLDYELNGNLIQRGTIPWQLQSGMPRP